MVLIVSTPLAQLMKRMLLIQNVNFEDTDALVFRCNRNKMCSRVVDRRNELDNIWRVLIWGRDLSLLARWLFSPIFIIFYLSSPLASSRHYNCTHDFNERQCRPAKDTRPMHYVQMKLYSLQTRMRRRIPCLSQCRIQD